MNEPVNYPRENGFTGMGQGAGEVQEVALHLSDVLFSGILLALRGSLWFNPICG